MNGTWQIIFVCWHGDVPVICHTGTWKCHLSMVRLLLLVASAAGMQAILQ
jgi:hypothetical protein